jgi:phage terminase large subunit GpA-like protein
MTINAETEVLHRLADAAWARLVPPPKVAPSDWAVRYRQIASMTAEMSGKWSWALFPHMRGVIDAFFEPGVRGLRCMKSTQAGWSETLATLLGFIIDMMAAPIIVLFPKEKKAKEFNLERFEPMVDSTPRLAAKVRLKSREKGITQTFKVFPGGWIKFVHSHSADEVKSSSARYGFVEEPDECDRDVRGQGSTVKLLLERLKTYFDSFSIMGGSPTLSELSSIEDEMKLTDKRKWYAACHHCRGLVPLDGEAWSLVKIPEEDSRSHPVYGKADPERAYMVCPHCGGIWTDAERAMNARNAEANGGGWKPTAAFNGLAGFYVSDLMSSSPGASLPRLAEKYLQAKHREASGDITGLIEFTNNQLGLAFKYKSPVPSEEELEARGEDYEELTVPWGGLRLTGGVDVQGDRIALVVVAWGRGEESWRVYWGELHGNPVDRSDAVWADLERMLFRPYLHASGAELHIEAFSVDSGDGNTADAVYEFCRKWKSRGAMAIKGREQGEIYRVPQPIDPGRRNKAAKYGLVVYQVGTERAKDLLIGFGEFGGRLRLSERDGDKVITGGGPGRMHWYRTIRGDYFRQVAAELKAPLKGRPRNKLYWQCKSGARNEALDCEVYALHAARKIKLNLQTEAQWQQHEQKLRQPDLIGAAARSAPEEVTPQPGEEAPAVPAPANKSNKAGAEVPRPQGSTRNTDPLLAQLERATGTPQPSSGMDRPY